MFENYPMPLLPGANDVRHLTSKRVSHYTHRNVKHLLSTIIFPLIGLLVLTSCSEYYKIIPHIRQYAPATTSVTVLDYPPTDFKAYLGTIKIVPADGSFTRRYGTHRAYEIMFKEAKAYGAKYIYIRNFSRPQYDSRTRFEQYFEKSFGEGTTVEIELYK